MISKFILLFYATHLTLASQSIFLASGCIEAEQEIDPALVDPL